MLGRNECILLCWPRSPGMSDCRRSYQLVSSHLFDSKPTTYGFRKKLEDIIVGNWENGKQKTKNFSETIQEVSQRS